MQARTAHEALAAHAVIAGPRLTLQALAPDDEDLFVGLYTDPVTMQHIAPPLAPAPAAASFAAALGQWRRACPRFLYWAVRRNRGMNGVGMVALSFDPTTPGQVEVGIMLGTGVLGQGLSTRALGLLAGHAFEHGLAGTLVAQHAHGNLASQRMLERLGFERMVHPDPLPGTYGWRLVAEQLRAPDHD